jgi:hypothetical protein
VKSIIRETGETRTLIVLAGAGLGHPETARKAGGNPRKRTPDFLEKPVFCGGSVRGFFRMSQL